MSNADDDLKNIKYNNSLSWKIPYIPKSLYSVNHYILKQLNENFTKDLNSRKRGILRPEVKRSNIFTFRKSSNHNLLLSDLLNRKSRYQSIKDKEVNTLRQKVPKVDFNDENFLVKKLRNHIRFNKSNSLCKICDDSLPIVKQTKKKAHNVEGIYPEKPPQKSVSSNKKLINLDQFNTSRKLKHKKKQVLPYHLDKTALNQYAPILKEKFNEEIMQYKSKSKRTNIPYNVSNSYSPKSYKEMVYKFDNSGRVNNYIKSSHSKLSLKEQSNILRYEALRQRKYLSSRVQIEIQLDKPFQEENQNLDRRGSISQDVNRNTYKLFKKLSSSTFLNRKSETIEQMFTEHDKPRTDKSLIAVDENEPSAFESDKSDISKIEQISIDSGIYPRNHKEVIFKKILIHDHMKKRIKDGLTGRIRSKVLEKQLEDTQKSKFDIDTEYKRSKDPFVQLRNAKLIDDSQENYKNYIKINPRLKFINGRSTTLSILQDTNLLDSIIINREKEFDSLNKKLIQKYHQRIFDLKKKINNEN